LGLFLGKNVFEVFLGFWQNGVDGVDHLSDYVHRAGRRGIRPQVHPLVVQVQVRHEILEVDLTQSVVTHGLSYGLGVFDLLVQLDLGEESIDGVVGVLSVFALLEVQL
jgi:hypothetical protein